MARGWLGTSEGLCVSSGAGPLHCPPTKHSPFLGLGAENKRAQGEPALLHALRLHTCRGRELGPSASPTPAGSQSALPVKAGSVSGTSICSSIPFQPTSL